MNIEKVFDFIKEKRGYDYPFIYKLVKGLPVSEDELNIEGHLRLGDTGVSFLPDNLNVHGFLSLTRLSKITHLPNNLTVHDDLYMNHTNIETIPNNLKVSGDLHLLYTPLSKKFGREAIRKIIEDKGGSIRGMIYTN